MERRRQQRDWETCDRNKQEREKTKTGEKGSERERLNRDKERQSDNRDGEKKRRIELT